MELTTLTNFFFSNMFQEDSWQWLHDDKGCFTVKILHEMLDKTFLINFSTRNSRNEVEQGYPKKSLYCIFIWQLQKKKITIYTWLDHIGIDLNSTLCPHCEDDIETVDHCFLNCPRVLQAWGRVFKLWNMGSFNCGLIHDIINHQKGLCSNGNPMCEVVP